MALAADDPERARREVREATAAWSQHGYLVQHWQAMRVEADVELYVGDTAGAYDREARDLPARRKSFLLRGQFTRVLTADLRGRCAIASSEAVPKERTARLWDIEPTAIQLGTPLEWPRSTNTRDLAEGGVRTSGQICTCPDTAKREAWDKQ
jgi:hypothetical protein